MFVVPNGGERKEDLFESLLLCHLLMFVVPNGGPRQLRPREMNSSCHLLMFVVPNGGLLYYVQQAAPGTRATC